MSKADLIAFIDLHSSMDRLKHILYNYLTTKLFNLHSSMDRLKLSDTKNNMSDNCYLHSSMDRLKPKLYPKGRLIIVAFTFQYG